eukprot:scaffold17047_cov104-Isochrysis_galbana.AAC.2
MAGGERATTQIDLTSYEKSTCPGVSIKLSSQAWGERGTLAQQRTHVYFSFERAVAIEVQPQSALATTARLGSTEGLSWARQRPAPAPLRHTSCSLDFERVERLRHLLARHHGPRHLKHAVGQGGLAVVHVRDDAEVAHALRRDLVHP